MNLDLKTIFLSVNLKTIFLFALGVVIVVVCLSSFPAHAQNFSEQITGYHAWVNSTLQPFNDSMCYVLDLGLVHLNNVSAQFQAYYAYQNASLIAVNGSITLFREFFYPLTHDLPNKVKVVITYILCLTVLGAIIRRN